MIFIPYEKITIQTNLSKEDIIDKIDSHISPQDSFTAVMRNAFAVYSSKYLFRGWVENGLFKISPISPISLQHIVHGKIKNNKVEMTIRLNYFTLAAYCLSLGFLGILLLAMLILPIIEILTGKISEGSSLFAGLIIGFVFLAIYSIMMFTFSLPLSNIKNTIKTLLSAD